jgi:hypothetical protein
MARPNVAALQAAKENGQLLTLAAFYLQVPKKASLGCEPSQLPQAGRSPFRADAIFLHRMARTTSFLPQLALRLRAYQWRRVGILAASTLVVSLVLVLYLFGVSDHFFSRLFTAFFVGFCLLAATFLAIIPFISWATTHWFGHGWEPEVRPGRAATSKPATSRPVSKAPAGRRSPSPLP